MECLTNQRLPPFNEYLGFEIDEWREGRTVILADVKSFWHFSR